MRGLGAGIRFGFTSGRRISIPVFTFYIDPVLGDDGNDGASAELAWLTTTPADAQVLGAEETIGYKSSGRWFLYRKLDMLASEGLLPANLVTADADTF